MSVIQKTIDDITRTKTSLNGSERIPMRDSLGDFKITSGNFNTPYNILSKRNATTPDSKVDVTINGTTYVLNIATSGVLGLDTGSESADSWYYIFEIQKEDGTKSAILSANSTAPTYPTDYVYSKLVSMVRNTSGNFVGFVQDGTNWLYISPQDLHNTSSATLDTGTLRDCSVFIPEKVSNIFGYYYSSAIKTASVYTIICDISGYNNSVISSSQRIYNNQSTAGNQVIASSNYTLKTTNRSIYTKSDNSTASPTTFSLVIRISGFEVPL